jgi:hypothetical protein
MTALPINLAALIVKHRHGDPASVMWGLTPDGVSINGLPAVGTPGEPMTVRRVWGWFGSQVAIAASLHGVPVEVLIANICAESAGDARTRDDCRNSTRHEPGYLSDAETPSRVSIGVMQTLISTARETLRQPSLSGDDLRDPAVSINVGTAYIAQQFAVTGFDPPLVAAAYNAGSLRPDAGSNRWRLLCYPTGTGAHIDRWVAFFNDAMRVSPEMRATIGTAPCFRNMRLTPV